MGESLRFGEDDDTEEDDSGDGSSGESGIKAPVSDVSSEEPQGAGSVSL